MNWKGKTRGGTFGYLFFIGMIKYLGITAAYGFLCLVIVYFIPFAPKATRSTWQYSRQILGLNRLRSIGMLFRNYYRLGQILIDRFAITSGMSGKYQFEFSNYKEFLDILDSEQGVIMIGAHVGNWEVGAPFFDKYGKKINIVLYDAEHKKIKQVLEKNGIEKDYKFIPVNQDDLAHVFKITEALDRKEYVCFQGDRYVGAERVMQTTFMGREARFPSGPFLLAARMKVPVVFYFAMREKGRKYHFHFVVSQKIERTKDKKPEQMLLEQYVRALEQIVKQYPEQWFNYYSFWNTFEPQSYAD
ncbi:acyltransferase [Bacteroides sp. 519]|nr:acyltransferase [Bacteroides sp. 519]NDV58765.1 acyltransferase [Bacteroides sp. 519]